MHDLVTDEVLGDQVAQADPGSVLLCDLYVAAENPRQRADLVIDHDDPMRPAIQRRWTPPAPGSDTGGVQ